MKVKANGIAINYRIDGPERAPWLVFSNSLATSLADADRIIRVADMEQILKFDAHADWVMATTFSQDAKYMITVSREAPIMRAAVVSA